MRKADIVVALGLMVVGLLALGDAVRLGFGWGMSGPESGFFPFYMGLGIVISTFFILLKAIKIYRKEGAWKTPGPGGRYRSDSLGIASCHRGSSIDRTARAPFGHGPLSCILYGSCGEDTLGQSDPLECSCASGRLCLI